MPRRTRTRRFSNQQHRCYGGVDRHARTLSLGILDQAGQVVLDHNLPANPDAFLRALAPFRDDLVVAVECLFCWYGLADRLRRRLDRVPQRAEALAPIQNTHRPYHDAPFGKKLRDAANREELPIADRFTDPSVRPLIAIDLARSDRYDERIGAVERYRTRTAQVDEATTWHRLPSVPGIGTILALVLMDEIHALRRLASVRDFRS